jgi:hypothetical protein
MSMNYRPEIRETFARFRLDEAQLRYSVAGGKSVAAAELIIQGPNDA